MHAFLTGLAWCGLGVWQSACGHASAEFKGTLLEAPEGEESGHSFDVEPNPEGLVAISGAEVRFCLDSCEGETRVDTTDESGEWGPLGSLFSGSSTTLIVRVKADGYAPYEYRTQYEDTSDPTNGQKYLNIRVEPASQPGPDDAGALDAGADAGAP